MLLLKYISPYSLFLCRGDVVHAGAGSKESFGHLRQLVHMYIGRTGGLLPDGINELKTFSSLEGDHGFEEMPDINEDPTRVFALSHILLGLFVLGVW